MTSAGPTWVVGAGGLLGRAVVRAAAQRQIDVVAMAVPWSDLDAACDALDKGFARLLNVAAGGPWSIAWCAGAGVTNTPAQVLEAELETLTRFVDFVLAHPPEVKRQGAVFLASSAGGVFAGSSDPPFTEFSTPAPLAAYGAAKLRAEATIARLFVEGGMPVLVGRISNLYGPGQDLSKAQGLISHLCRSQLTAQPLAVYVSLDTLRDYLFVDDAADMVLDGLVLLRCRPEGRSAVVVKILASQRSVSIAELIGEFRRLIKKQPLLRLAASPSAAQQARILRFRSVVWPELDARPLTPLGAGIMATSADIRQRVLRGDLALRV